MIEIVGETLPQKTLESPIHRERLSDEQMGNLLSAVGNHGAKAITLILMRNGDIFSKSTLYEKVLNSQGDNRGWRMDKGAPFGYCLQSFAPIGLVAKEILNKDLSIYGYAITDYGKELGIPLAGHLLDFSERHNIPLNLLFGSTISNSKSTTILTKEGEEIEFRNRSPSTTLKILYELLTSPKLPIREADLIKGIGASYHLRTAVTHLTRLSKLGLIQYDSTEVNKSFSSHKLSSAIPEGKLPVYEGLKTLTQLVYNVLKNHPDQFLTAEDIYNLLPNDQKETWKSKKSLYPSISGTLFLLTKHKYTDLERFHGDKRSEINITDDQKVVLSELLEIMYGLQNQDPKILYKGRRLAVDIISDPKRVAGIMRKTKEASSSAGKSSREETQKIILSIIQSHPGGITNKEIQKLLKEQYNKQLSRGRINELFSLRIVKNRPRAIRIEREGIVNKFYPGSESTQPVEK